jgi:ABC-type amino acid transport substrate-binding protein
MSNYVEYLYAFFVRVFLRRYLTTVVGPLALLLLALGVCGFFSEYGLPELFWVDGWGHQLAIGVALAVTFVISTFIGYTIETRRMPQYGSRVSPEAWAWWDTPVVGVRAPIAARRLFAAYLLSMGASWIVVLFLITVGYHMVRFVGAFAYAPYLIVGFVVPVAGIAAVIGLGNDVLCRRVRRRFIARMNAWYSPTSAPPATWVESLWTTRARTLVALSAGALLAMRLKSGLAALGLAILAVCLLRYSKQRNLAAKAHAVLAGAIVLVTTAMVIALDVDWMPRFPALAVCVFTILAIATWTLAMYFRWASVIVGAILVALVVMAGGERFRYRVPGLERFYPSGAASVAGAPRAGVNPGLRHACVEGADPGALASGGPQPDAARPSVRWADWSPDGKRPLIMVAVSGGGIASALWTADVLLELEAMEPELAYHIRVVSGASGGMVGAAAYVSTLNKPVAPAGATPPWAPAAPDAGAGTPAATMHAARGVPLTREGLLKAVSSDSLSAVAHALVFNDIPLLAYPWSMTWDRGRALEQAWGESLATFDQPLEALRQGEAEGWRPSLVFSPVLIEDGRRLLISNLDLSRLAVNEHMGPSGIKRPASVDCLELFAEFPGSAGTFKLGTAARLNSTFPLVSPTPALPISGRRRVADAGYFDNFGVELACRWLATNEEWVRQNASRVLILEIRTFPRAENTGDQSGVLSRCVEDLAGPPVGAFEMRAATMRFRNDRQIKDMIDRYGRPGLPPIASELIECPASNVPLTWRLTEAQAQRIRAGLKDTGVTGAMWRVVEWCRGEHIARGRWCADPAVQNIIRNKCLRVAVSDGSEMGHFLFRDSDGRLQGFDIQLGAEIAQRLRDKLKLPDDVKLEIVGPVSWPQQLLTLRSRQADLVISSLSYSPEREYEYGIRFSVPYKTAQLGLLYAKGWGRLDADGRSFVPPPDTWPATTVCVQKDTSSVTIARRLAKLNPKIEVHELAEMRTCLDQFVKDTGGRTVVLGDEPYLASHKDADTMLEPDMVGASLGVPHPVAMLFRESWASAVAPARNAEGRWNDASNGAPVPAERLSKWSQRTTVLVRAGSYAHQIARRFAAAKPKVIAIETRRTLQECVDAFRADKTNTCVVFSDEADLRSFKQSGTAVEPDVVGHYLDTPSLPPPDPGDLESLIATQRQEFYSVGVASDCPQLLWAVNAVIADLHRPDPSSPGASLIETMEAGAEAAFTRRLARDPLSVPAQPIR